MAKKLFRAIFIDDEIWALRGIQGVVDWEELGFENVGAFTGVKEAYESITTLKPDVIFTDIRMPEIDGMALIEKVKELFPNVSFVIVSAYKDFEIAKKAFKNNVADYLIKPLDKAEVKTTAMALYNKLCISEENAFNIMNYDMLSHKDASTTEVRRFLNELSHENGYEILVSEKDLSDIVPGLTVINVKGCLYAYITEIIDDADRFKHTLSGIKIGLSTPAYSFDEISSKANEAIKSYIGYFFYSKNEQAAKIQGFLYDNLDKKLSMDDICNEFYLSKSYVFELFRIYTDTSVMGFLKDVRLSRAKDLLKHTNNNVGKIASMVGFDDAGYFTKTFKLKYGITPEQYSLKQ
jgi:two-component system response regulator YesN